LIFKRSDEIVKILVTGATGFVGSVLLPELIKKFGAESVSVYVLPDDKIPEAWENQKISVFYGDIADGRALLEACRHRTHVIHLAGYISYLRRDFHRLMRINYEGVRRVVDACLRLSIPRLIHISSVGALGFDRTGIPTDENTPFNWPPYVHYMTSKYLGQRIVEEAARQKGLQAVILNPASIMGPGDPRLDTPHNQLYAAIYKGRLFGSFGGGLGVVDVRDVVAIIIKALERGRTGEKYLLAGANLAYTDILRLVGKHARRPVYPFRVPASFLAATGLKLELVSRLTRKKPLLTYAYGRLSGWKTYYSSEKSRKEFSHDYIDIEKTIKDSCAYFETAFLRV
jgi:dihydroflavonol-4-reductase